MPNCKDLSPKANDRLDGAAPLRTRIGRYFRRQRPAPGAPPLPADADDGDRAPKQVSPVKAGRQPSSEPEVVIYTTSWCPYCRRAKALLEKKGVDYFEIDLGKGPERRREMIARAGGRASVPQIFIRGRGIGGSDELRALEAADQLDRLLGRD
jgi:glutaredoxin 3